MPVRHARRGSARRQYVGQASASGRRSRSLPCLSARILGKSERGNHAQSRQDDPSTPNAVPEPPLHSCHFQFLPFQARREVLTNAAEPPIVAAPQNPAKEVRTIAPKCLRPACVGEFDPCPRSEPFRSDVARASNARPAAHSYALGHPLAGGTPPRLCKECHRPWSDRPLRRRACPYY